MSVCQARLPDYAGLYVLLAVPNQCIDYSQLYTLCLSAAGELVGHSLVSTKLLLQVWQCCFSIVLQ